MSPSVISTGDLPVDLAFQRIAVIFKIRGLVPLALRVDSLAESTSGAIWDDSGFRYADSATSKIRAAARGCHHHEGEPGPWEPDLPEWTSDDL